MIRSLQGTVAAAGENTMTVVVGGIGYLVYTPKVRAVLGEEVFLHTHLVVRETVLDLYGFFDEASLTFFELLMTIPKIGPKSALQILTQADPTLLAEAITTRDATPLQKLAGMGKKTAENIVNHLAEKIDLLPTTLAHVTFTSSLTPAQADAIDALITLGYDAKLAHSFVQKQDKAAATNTLIQLFLKDQPLG